MDEWKEGKAGSGDQSPQPLALHKALHAPMTAWGDLGAAPADHLPGHTVLGPPSTPAEVLCSPQRPLSLLAVCVGPCVLHGQPLVVLAAPGQASARS